MTRITYLLVISAAAGCGSDPVSYSAPVGINLKAKAGDVANNAISESKGITTETGNPYGAFVTDATKKLGHAPGSVEVNDVTLILGGDSKNVANLETVFGGQVDVAFVIDDTNNTYDVAQISQPAGVGPDALSVSFDAAAIAAQDLAKYLNGGFKVVVRGDAAAGFSGSAGEASLQITLTFAAYE